MIKTTNEGKMKKQNLKSQRGFNLIEIAIVLAVVGLIIGGIYTAASAVTENNRRRNTQTQLLTIVQNIRTTYASQTAFAVPSNTEIESMRLFPGDLVLIGGNFVNSYGGNANLYAPSAARFTVEFTNVSQGGCVELLTKSFGTQGNVNQIGLVAAGRSAAGTITDAGVAGGVTIAEANTNCNADPIAVGFTFNLRG